MGDSIINHNNGGQTEILFTFCLVNTKNIAKYSIQQSIDIQSANLINISIIKNNGLMNAKS